MQGNEIIKLINASNISTELKYGMKGRMYYEASSFKNAIDEYMKVRNELKSNDLFSKELFKTYKSANMISEATNELVNIFRHLETVSIRNSYKTSLVAICCKINWFYTIELPFGNPCIPKIRHLPILSIKHYPCSTLTLYHTSLCAFAMPRVLLLSCFYL